MSSHAFPNEETKYDVYGNEMGVRAVGGLTKREYAAIHIAAGLASDFASTPSLIAEYSVQITDALLAELEKEKP